MKKGRKNKWNRTQRTKDRLAGQERIVLALGAKGLVNAQFIVRDDGVYLIEVNPRASRTVPFLSKVTGVPMVELAVRIALGETLAGLGWSGGLLAPPALVAVKAPAFSTAKLRGVDPSLGPGMQSTGEGIGLHQMHPTDVFRDMPVVKSGVRCSPSRTLEGCPRATRSTEQQRP